MQKPPQTLATITSIQCIQAKEFVIRLLENDVIVNSQEQCHKCNIVIIFHSSLHFYVATQIKVLNSHTCVGLNTGKSSTGGMRP